MEINESVIDLINKLEGFKTCLQTVHWDASSLTEHRLCDDVKEALDKFEDTVAEIEQGLSGAKIKEVDVVPQRQSANGLMELLTALLENVKAFYAGVVELGIDYIGMASETETFVGELQKLIYQCSLIRRAD